MGGGESGLLVMLRFEDSQSKTAGGFLGSTQGASEHGKGVTSQALVGQQQKFTFQLV